LSIADKQYCIPGWRAKNAYRVSACEGIASWQVGGGSQSIRGNHVTVIENLRIE